MEFQDRMTLKTLLSQMCDERYETGLCESVNCAESCPINMMVHMLKHEQQGKIIARLKKEHEQYRQDIIDNTIAEIGTDNPGDVTVAVLEKYAAGDAARSDVINAVENEICWDDFSDELADKLAKYEGDLLAEIVSTLWSNGVGCAENEAIAAILQEVFYKID